MSPLFCFKKKLEPHMQFVHLLVHNCFIFRPYIRWSVKASFQNRYTSFFPPADSTFSFLLKLFLPCTLFYAMYSQPLQRRWHKVNYMLYNTSLQQCGLCKLVTKQSLVKVDLPVSVEWQTGQQPELHWSDLTIPTRLAICSGTSWCGSSAMAPWAPYPSLDPASTLLAPGNWQHTWDTPQEKPGLES